MKIAIPNSAFLGNINTFLSSFDPADEERLEITTNPKWLSVHPMAIAMIGALGKQIEPSNISCDDIIAPSGHYLVTMGLFDFLGIKPAVKSIEQHELTGRLIPLRQIKTSGDLDRFLEDLVPLLHLDKEPKHAEAIQHIFSELIWNVLEHSQSKHGAAVCAQYFEKSNKIAIGVADVGVGLMKSLRRSHKVPDHTAAIKLALTPGVTGTTAKPGGTPQNAGFGLFLIKSIAYVNFDYFNIVSGNKMYKLLQRKKVGEIRLQGNPFEDRHSLMDLNDWPGVAVGVDISLSQTQEFTDLLDDIHSFYTSEVRGQKKTKYKKPRFV